MTQPIVFVSGTSWYLWNFRRSTLITFRQRGFRVVVVAPTDEWAPRLSADCDVEHIPWSVDLDGAHPGREAMSVLRLAWIVAKLRPRFVFNYSIKPNIYGGLACRMLRTPYANHVTGLGMAIARGGHRARALSYLYAFASSGAERVFFQNPNDLDLLRRAGLRRSTPVAMTMGSGIDLKAFPATPMPPSEPRIFVFVGRLQQNKGVREFVSVARRLARAVPGTRFLIIGSRRHANRHAIPDAEIDTWRAEGVVEIFGHKDEIAEILSAAHALVLPSHGGEGMPRVVLEAASVGRPVIVSNVPGCRDAVIPGKTGFIYPLGNEGELLACMREIATMPLRRLIEMGHAARELAEIKFSERQVVDASLDCVVPETTGNPF